jgi:hypothetical protein
MESAAQPPVGMPWHQATFPASFGRFWRGYGVFHGRAARAEFWFWALWWFLIGLVANVAFGAGVLTMFTGAGGVAAPPPQVDQALEAFNPFPVWGYLPAFGLAAGVADRLGRLHGCGAGVARAMDRDYRPAPAGRGQVGVVGALGRRASGQCCAGGSSRLAIDQQRRRRSGGSPLVPIGDRPAVTVGRHGRVRPSREAHPWSPAQALTLSCLAGAVFAWVA